MSGRWQTGQTVYWVTRDAEERSGAVVDGGAFHVSISTDIGMESYAEDQVFATPLEAWQLYIEFARREVEHHERNLRRWVDRRTTAHGRIHDLKASGGSLAEAMQ